MSSSLAPDYAPVELIGDYIRRTQKEWHTGADAFVAAVHEAALTLALIGEDEDELRSDINEKRWTKRTTEFFDAKEKKTGKTVSPIERRAARTGESEAGMRAMLGPDMYKGQINLLTKVFVANDISGTRLVDGCWQVLEPKMLPYLATCIVDALRKEYHYG
ncbi:hypothetical protein BLS_004306 [Venturia inaequalis]|uniref:Uncharacterized protein n=1 Tax=Venturia inaequalis TaxID=5025 RepID=A0A8H3UK87_VENIN|nr:hypothetical protein BLS_004306 [Venturia inaequalis]